MIPPRAVLAEWWLNHSPYWRGYRAGLRAHQRAKERYARLQLVFDKDETHTED